MNSSIGINAGLWLESPDIDATTWLNGTVQGVKYNGDDKFTLAIPPGSVNTQNTSVTRELIHIIFVFQWDLLFRRNYSEYGDILGGYLALACMEHTKYHTSFGRPIADHKRNPHDYLTDLSRVLGHASTDWLLEKLSLKKKILPLQAES